MLGVTRERGQTCLGAFTTNSNLSLASLSQVHPHRPPRTVASTSVEAYAHLYDTGVLGEQCVQYLQLLADTVDGLTDSEAARLLNLPCSTISARRNDCNRGSQGFLVVNFDGEKRMNTSGRSALVWRMVK